MTKELESIQFDPLKCESELKAFRKFLDSNDDLEERRDIQPFFQNRKQLSAFIGSYAPEIGRADLIAFEFPFLGDFKADLLLGNQETGSYCVVEFEDGKRDSIFRKRRNRSMTEWSPRFEHGFSQLVDWCFALDDFKKTDRYAKDFGHGYVRFVALLIVGRNSGITEYDRKRLRWRSDKVRVDSHPIECMTFDDLYTNLRMRINFYHELSQSAKKRRT